MDAQEQFARYPLSLREEAYQAVRLQIGPDAPMKIRDLLAEVEAIMKHDIDTDAIADGQLRVDHEMQRLEAEIVVTCAPAIRLIHRSREKGVITT